jgi:SAM-dependent methyltransferase
LGAFLDRERSRGAFLDIGCNRGLFLEAARRRGWQVTGVEIAEAAAQLARAGYGLTVLPDLAALPARAGFDLVTAWHVLEHTLQPAGFIKAARQQVRPGGILALQVPSYDYVAEFQSRDQQGSLICAVHNFYFTLHTLRRLLDRCDLEVLHLDNDPKHLMLTAVCRRPLPLWQRVAGRLKRRAQTLLRRLVRR